MTTTKMPESGYPLSMTIPIEFALQAVIAARDFGPDAGLAALAAYQDDEREHVCVAKGTRTSIYPGAGNTVRLAAAARNLLALAETEASTRMDVTEYTAATIYDLTDAQPSSVVGFRLGSED